MWNQKFSRQDSLRGTLSAARSCYDVKFYDLNVKVDVSRKFIAGTNAIKFVALRDFSLMQIDLFSNMTLKSISYENRKVGFRRDGNAIFITLPKQKKGATGNILIEYEGTPTEALNPPWKGGFVWKKDKNGKPWVGVACEGLGASCWWPNKDHLSDEPDSMRIRVAVPDGLFCVSNGNLRSRKSRDDGYADFEWFVSYPINNYNVTLNIADYIRIADTYTASDSSKLELEFYCLPYNFNKANLQFKQVKPMLKAYEHYFGKYPFWNDGYCLVETSYLGMEHQGAIAYGNQYKKGYLGGRIPEGMDWDYIIIHESGHEYFGNSLSCTDHAEMWLHESFTTYMEALYVEYTMGFSEAIRYLESQRNDIFNEDPIVGPLKVNFDNWRGSDSYYKGSWMLHTLRSSINNDPLFFKLLRQFYESHEHGFATTEDFIALTNKLTQKDFSSFFKQYLYRPEIPVLKYYVKQHKKGVMLFYRWEKVVENFKMPIRVGDAGNYISIVPSNKWQKVYLRNCSKNEMVVPTQLFLIEKEKVLAEPKF
ncbi:MAG: M1 family metallopeptidase [Saprospiraceae bacterium]